VVRERDREVVDVPVLLLKIIMATVGMISFFLPLFLVSYLGFFLNNCFSVICNDSGSRRSC
jgi:hypothetical protein